MLEESLEGWVVAYACAVHSDHCKDEPRVLSEAERCATHNEHNSKIPDELLNLVTTDMLSLRLSISEILTFINKKAVDLKHTINWTYADVFNHFRASGSERVHDSRNLLETLKKREEDSGLQYRARLDELGRLVEVFFEIVRATRHARSSARGAQRDITHAIARA
jgi:hypothetical protein